MLTEHFAAAAKLMVGLDWSKLVCLDVVRGGIHVSVYTYRDFWGSTYRRPYGCKGLFGRVALVQQGPEVAGVYVATCSFLTSCGKYGTSHVLLETLCHMATQACSVKKPSALSNTARVEIFTRSHRKVLIMNRGSKFDGYLLAIQVMLLQIQEVWRIDATVFV